LLSSVKVGKSPFESKGYMSVLNSTPGQATPSPACTRARAREYPGPGERELKGDAPAFRGLDQSERGGVRGRGSAVPGVRFGEVDLSVPKGLVDRYLKGLPVDPKSLL
jgi:hypothetical protein